MVANETITVIITTIVTSFATSSPAVRIDNTVALAFFIPFLVVSIAIALFCAFAYTLSRKMHNKRKMKEQQLLAAATTNTAEVHLSRE
jgi:hypothetical protein